jgi:transposase
LKKAEVKTVSNPGVTTTESAKLREAKRRVRLLGQEAEAMLRAKAYLSQNANPR